MSVITVVQSAVEVHGLNFEQKNQTAISPNVEMKSIKKSPGFFTKYGRVVKPTQLHVSPRSKPAPVRAGANPVPGRVEAQPRSKPGLADPGSDLGWVPGGSRSGLADPAPGRVDPRPGPGPG